MARFLRQCKNCRKVYNSNCELCHGVGSLLKPITVYGLKIAIDNRPPTAFHVIIKPTGEIEFKQKGKRIGVKTTMQICFNRARMDSAQDALVAKTKKKNRKTRKMLIW